MRVGVRILGCGLTLTRAKNVEIFTAVHILATHACAQTHHTVLAVRRNPAYCAEKWAAADGMLCVNLSSTVKVGSALLVAACYLPPLGLRQLDLHTERPVAPHLNLHTVLAPDEHPSAPAPSSSLQFVANKSAFGPARR